MHIRFSSKQNKKSDVLVIGLPAFDGKVSAQNSALNLWADEINHNIACDAKFQGNVGQTLSFAAPEDSGYKKVVLLGLGNKRLEDAALRSCGNPVYDAIKATGYEKADVLIGDTKKAKMKPAKAAAILADAVNAASYSFDKYITDERTKQTKPAKLNFITTDIKGAKAAYEPLSHVTQGEFLAADMGNEPGNAMYPKSAVSTIKRELADLPGVKIKIIDTKEMRKEKMRAALGVAQGSVNKPYMVVVEYDGTNGKTKDWPLALVGKGVTFDSGGISIKPSAGMGEMKMDMGGAAAVVGAMRALAGRKANTKVVAICGFVENMPDGKAQRPGDIVKTRSGKTVVVDNTDAEGRLVLCDAMDYIQDKYKPKTMLDLATLTGAVLVSLEHLYSGVFTQSDKLWKKLKKSGEKSSQPGWRLPLHERFKRAVTGKICDLTNSAPLRWAGSSTAAQFLHQFVKSSTEHYAHLDVAGTAIPANGIANGHGVRWLDRFVADYFESKGPAAIAKAPELKK